MNIQGITDDEVFNILLEYESTKLPEQWKLLYPTIHISRPVTAAAESAALRKFIILIGAGSGIAPYLSFIEDETKTC